MAPTPPASWYPDPTGGHDHRYWDGHNWTEHVATQGQQAVDPVQVVLFPPVVTHTPAPGWYSDPSGSDERRYWDDQAWTDRVQPGAPGSPRAPSGISTSKSDRRITRQVRRVGNTPGVGGKTLFTEQVLVVNQKVKRFGSGIGYTVYDQTGHELGAIQEVRRDLGAKMSDNLRGRTDKNRTYRFQVVDAEGRVLLGMTRPESWFTAKSTMIVEDPHSAPLGHIVQETHGVTGALAQAAKNGLGSAGYITRRSIGGVKGVAAGAAASLIAAPLVSKTRGPVKSGHVRFGLEADGERLGSIQAETTRSWEFSIRDSQDREIGRVTKTWAGWAKERFTKSDNYVMQMHHPLDDPLLSLVIAAALALDIALKQGDPTRGSGSTRRYN